MKKADTIIGKHLLGELHNIDPSQLDDIERLTEILNTAVKKSGATVCGQVRKKFIPQGVTVLLLLEESHASFHSYPERGSLFLDIFTCGEQCDPERAFRYICESLHAKEFNIRVISRHLNAQPF